MLLLKTSAGDSSSPGTGKSNGLMWLVELREMSKDLPPVASAKNWYSFSGSITITSVSNIKLLSISNFVVYDLPEPDFAKVTEL